MFAVYSQDVCGTVVTSFLFVCCLYVCSLYNEGDCKQCSLCVPLMVWQSMISMTDLTSSVANHLNEPTSVCTKTSTFHSETPVCKLVVCFCATNPSTACQRRFVRAPLQTNITSWANRVSLSSIRVSTSSSPSQNGHRVQVRASWYVQLRMSAGQVSKSSGTSGAFAASVACGCAPLSMKGNWAVDVTSPN